MDENVRALPPTCHKLPVLPRGNDLHPSSSPCNGVCLLPVAVALWGAAITIPPPHCLTRVESGIPEVTLSKSVSLLPCFLLGSPPMGPLSFCTHISAILPPAPSWHGLTPSLMGKILSPSQCFLPWRILKVPLLSPCPAIGRWQLYFTIRANWGQASCSLCVRHCKWVSWVTQLAWAHKAAMYCHQQSVKVPSSCRSTTIWLPCLTWLQGRTWLGVVMEWRKDRHTTDRHTQTESWVWVGVEQRGRVITYSWERRLGENRQLKSQGLCRQLNQGAGLTNLGKEQALYRSRAQAIILSGRESQEGHFLYTPVYTHTCMHTPRTPEGKALPLPHWPEPLGSFTHKFTHTLAHTQTLTRREGFAISP
jgi:hypothetical protein